MGIRKPDAALADTERALLDSSALIAFHVPHESVHRLARHILGRIEDFSDPLHGYLSVITASELLIRPIRSGAVEFTFMHTFLTSFPNLVILPVDLPVALQAANLRAMAGIRLPDALTIATALLSGCESIVSNDERWNQRLVPLFRDFRWIHLGDYL